MPRPTAAQLVHGSCTVILSTLVMLLLSGVRSAVGVAVVAVVALGLGVLVSVVVPARRPARRTRTAVVTHRPAAPDPAGQSSAARDSSAPAEPVTASLASDN
ncbi:hypothetical protein [Streptomyces sp. NPDC053367]|uniref:hypothetical protein n=1 Tax=Streptomyces sp. NPDC053367 TaxID=3365700 RepID=UPI0037D6D6A7